MSNITQHRISQMPRWPWIYVSCVVLLGVCYLLYNSHVKQQARAVRAQNIEKISEIVNGLAKKYNAVGVPQQRPGHFSANYADMLIRVDRRPVLFLGRVEDVGRSGERYLLLLDSYEPISLDLQFNLTAENDKAQQVMRGRRGTEWAVVAIVLSVSSQQGPMGQDVMLAQGTCVDLVSLDVSGVMDYVLGDPARQ